MDKETFVNNLRISVHESNINGTISILEKPPGRRPRPEDLELSQWFNALSDQDRDFVTEIIKLTSHGAVFGLLCVLDGVRKNEDSRQPGKLILSYQKDNQVIPLNDESGYFLHELFNAEE